MASQHYSKIILTGLGAIKQEVCGTEQRMLSWLPHPFYINCTMARRPQGLYTLRNNPDIARFVIEGEANGRQLGTGSYGSVEEVNYKLANYYYCDNRGARPSC